MIGGTCIELRAEGRGLLLDIGMPLVNPDGSGFDEDSSKRPVEDLINTNLLPNVPGLYDKTSCDIAGIVLTHAHRDHFGLGHFVKSGIPVFSSEITNKLIGATRMFFRDNTIDPVRLTSLEAWKPVSIGPFIISTYPVDHSAPGAIAVEVSAVGKKVFYTGDLRAHGYKYRMFEHIINSPPQNVDVLIMEGSSLGRKPDEYPFPDEPAVRDAIIKEIKDEKALVLLFCSSQNVDRIVSANRAAQSSGRELVLDYYTAYILHLLEENSEGIARVLNTSRFLYWRGHGEGLRNVGEINFLSYIKAKKARILPEEIIANPQKFLIIAKANRRLAEITKGLAPEQIKCIWSMWSGYLEDPGSFFQKFCDDKNIKYEQIHTSGHAVIEDLGRLVKAINPLQLVPIHTFYPEEYKRFIDPAKVKVLQDGDVYEI
jgi:ribonuclease J